VGPFDGTHVASTTPLLGESVTVMVRSPVGVGSATSTHSVWPLEVPQVGAACATVGTKTVAATSKEKTPTHASGFRGDTITIRPDRLKPNWLLMAAPRRLPPCLAATAGCRRKGSSRGGARSFTAP